MADAILMWSHYRRLAGGHAGWYNQPSYMAYVTELCGGGLPAATGPAVAAFVNCGRWLWQCRDCLTALLAEFGEASSACPVCSVQVPVVWPPHKQAIEAQLLKVPGHGQRAPLRNWRPGVSIAALKRLVRRTRKLQRQAGRFALLTHASIAPARVWEYRELLSATNMNLHLGGPMDDLAGRNGVIEVEDSVELTGVGPVAAAARRLALPAGRPAAPLTAQLVYNTGYASIDAYGLGTGGRWGSLLTAGAVGYEYLAQNGGVGVGAAQVAAGNHIHPAPPRPTIVSVGPRNGALRFRFAGLQLQVEVNRLEYRYRTTGEWTAWTAYPGGNYLTEDAVVSGLSNGVLHHFEWRAISQFGVSPAATASGTPTSAPGLPPAPTGLEARYSTLVVNNQPFPSIRANWTAILPEWQASSIDVELTGGGLSTFQAHGLGVADSYHAAANQSYTTFRIRYVNQLGAGAWATVAIEGADDNADLDGLSVSPGALSPVFSASTTAYTARVNTGASVSVSASAVDTDARIRIVHPGGATSGGDDVSISYTASTTAGLAQTISITVTAPDNVTTQTYTLTITTVAVAEPSTTDIDSVEIEPGEITETTTPPPDSVTLRSSTQSADQTSVQLRVTLDTPSTSTMTIAGTTTASGALSAAIPIAVGQTTISIVVTNTLGESAAYNVQVTRPAPPEEPTEAPAAISLTASPGRLLATLRFTPPAAAYNITGYQRRQRAGRSGAFSAWTAFTPTVIAGTARHAVTGLTAATEYGFQVRASNLDTNGATQWGVASNIAYARPFAPSIVNVRPAAPTISSVTPRNNSMLIRWSHPDSDIDSFWLQVTPPGGGYTELPAVSTAGRVYVLDGLTNGVTYTVRLIARRNNLDSLPSAAASGTPALPVPNTPTSLTATSGGDGASIALAWSSVPFASSYQIRYRTGTSRNYSAVTTVTTTSHTYSGLTPAVVYRFEVRAVNASGQSPWSAAVGGYIAVSRPGPVTGLTAVRGNGWLQVDWTALAEAESYDVQAQLVGDTPTTIGWTRTALTSASVVGLTNGVEVRVYVRALNQGGAGPVTSVVGRPGYFNTPQRVRLGFDVLDMALLDNTMVTVRDEAFPNGVGMKHYNPETGATTAADNYLVGVTRTSDFLGRRIGTLGGRATLFIQIASPDSPRFANGDRIRQRPFRVQTVADWQVWDSLLAQASFRFHDLSSITNWPAVKLSGAGAGGSSGQLGSGLRSFGLMVGQAEVSGQQLFLFQGPTQDVLAQQRPNLPDNPTAPRTPAQQAAFEVVQAFDRLRLYRRYGAADVRLVQAWDLTGSETWTMAAYGTRPLGLSSAGRLVWLDGATLDEVADIPAEHGLEVQAELASDGSSIWFPARAVGTSGDYSLYKAEAAPLPPPPPGGQQRAAVRQYSGVILAAPSVDWVEAQSTLVLTDAPRLLLQVDKTGGEVLVNGEHYIPAGVDNAVVVLAPNRADGYEVRLESKAAAPITIAAAAFG